MAIVYGTSYSETINASDGVTDLGDTIYGYAGNDTISGFGGDDLIIGGLGGDIINGGSGIDTAIYTDSAAGVTVSLSTGTGSGGAAQGDTLTSIENLYGSGFADVLTGNSANNSLAGMDGNDILKGGGGADVLSGGDGDDTLLGGSGADTLYGGSGIDTASYASSSHGVQVDMAFHHAYSGDAEGDILSGIENLTGSAYNDSLRGDKGVNVLIGGDGNDTLDGGGSADTMIGGEGDDNYYIQNPNDVIVEAVGEGVDSLSTTVSYTLAAGIEVEEMFVNGEGTTTNLNLTGNEFVQYIGGNEGDNIIDGAGGADTMEGRIGNDTYYADTESDYVIEQSGQGNDTVFSSAYSYTLSSFIETLSLDTATDTGVYGTGNAQSNTIFGNVNDNILEGGGSADVLNGLGGNDSFVFRPGDANGDVVHEFAGNGAGVGDFMYFIGYGTAAEGASFVQLTADTWQINSADGLTHDVVTFVGAPTIDAGDFVFV